MRSKTTALSILGCILAANASAYTVYGGSWAWQGVPVQEPWELNVGSFPVTTGSSAEIEDAWLSAADRWTALHADFAYAYVGQTPDYSWSQDSRMVVQWVPGTPSLAVLAQTAIYSGSGNNFECDIEFYGSNGAGDVSWSADPLGGDLGAYDFEEVAVHELGHCLGLDHSLEPDAAMYVASTSGGGPVDRDLHADDVAGFDALYNGITGVVQPDLLLVTVTLTDPDNEDGLLEAGERIGVSISVDNDVATLATQAYATLGSLSANLVVVHDTLAPTEVDHPGNANLTYVDGALRVADDCVTAEDEVFTIQLHADNHAPALLYEITVQLDCQDTGVATGTGGTPTTPDPGATTGAGTTDTGLSASGVDDVDGSVPESPRTSGCSHGSNRSRGWLMLSVLVLLRRRIGLKTRTDALGSGSVH